jgi:trk system potassium uptake protein TrkA
VDKTDLFVGVYPDRDQNVNIVSAMLAKELGAKKVTARINTSEYLSYENKSLFTQLGIDLMFYPERMAAYEIADLVRESGMTEFVHFGHGKLQLVEFKIEEDSPLIGREISDFVYPIEHLPFRIVAISRSEGTLIPVRDSKMRLGDLIYVMTMRDTVADALKEAGKREKIVKNVYILGGGPMGEMLAAKLEKTVPLVTIIEQDRRRCEELSQILEKTMVINGDWRNTDWLYEEDVQHCDVFVAVTDDSETNIMTSAAVKKMGVPKTIAEVENIEYIKLAEGMGVDAVINKKILSASRIFRFTLTDKIRSIKYLSESDAIALEYIVHPGSPVTQGKIKELNIPPDAIIGGVIRGSESFIAYGDTQIAAYDHVVVFTLPSSLKQIDKLFM